MYFGSIFHVITSGLFLCQVIPKLDLNELANYKSVIWKKWRMQWIQNRDSQPAAPWLFVPFENSKGTFKRKLSLAEGGVSWSRPKLSANHNPETLVVVLSQSQLLPWPFVLCRTARSYAEELQAAQEGGVSLYFSIKLHIAQL